MSLVGDPYSYIAQPLRSRCRSLEIWDSLYRIYLVLENCPYNRAGHALQHWGLNRPSRSVYKISIPFFGTIAGTVVAFM
jgi:hypothetical protein